MGGTLWRKRMTRGPCSVVVVVLQLHTKYKTYVPFCYPHSSSVILAVVPYGICMLQVQRQLVSAPVGVSAWHLGCVLLLVGLSRLQVCVRRGWHT